jgi:hypothetical protein
MTKDTLMTKVSKMQYLLDYLTDDPEEQQVIVMHLFAHQADPTLDASKVIKSVAELKAMRAAKEKLNGGSRRWL